MSQEDKHIVDDLQVNRIQMPSDSYFEALKQNILAEIENNVPVANGTKKKEQTRIISMYRRWYVWGSAAAIGAFALLFPWNNSNPSPDSEPVNLSSVSNEEIYDYLKENIEDLDAETIAVHLSDDALANSYGLQTEETTPAKEDLETFSSKSTMLEHIEDEEILDYLKEESGELDEYLLIES
ncbi:hypothetical protein [Fluviicola sp.]|uniref:hypothetical protein n=1 Tax=Fluviicola sp. TaxID=1917219 RepID=UPI0031D10B62